MALFLYAFVLLLIGIQPTATVDPTPPPYQCPLDGKEVHSKKIEAQNRLSTCLMTDYLPGVRPALSTHGKTKVTVKIDSISISQMLEKEDFMSLDVQLTYVWNDYRLKWSPDAYEGLQFIYLRTWGIWTPEIILYDGRTETGAMTNLYVKSFVNFTGDVVWTPQIRAHAYCQGDYSNFPFDTQRCKFSFQRQMYEEENILIEVLNGYQLTRRHCYSVHPEWSVVNCSSYVQEETLGNESSQSVVLDMSVKRNYKYHEYVIILPSVILCLLVLSLYWVPHHSNQRFALAGGLLFACLMANFLLQNFIPLGVGSIPVVVSYLLYVMIMIIITTIASLITLNLASVDPSTHTMPEIVKKFLLNDIVLKMTGVVVAGDVVEKEATSFENTTWKKSGKATSGGGGGSSDGGSDRMIDSICKQLEALAQASSSSSSSTLDNPWKQLSQVVDRLLFYIFFFIFIIVTSDIYAH